MTENLRYPDKKLALVLCRSGDQTDLAWMQYQMMSTSRVKIVDQNKKRIRVRSKYSNRHKLNMSRNKTVYMSRKRTFMKVFM